VSQPAPNLCWVTLAIPHLSSARCGALLSWIRSSSIVYTGVSRQTRWTPAVPSLAPLAIKQNISPKVGPKQPEVRSGRLHDSPEAPPSFFFLIHLCLDRRYLACSLLTPFSHHQWLLSLCMLSPALITPFLSPRTHKFFQDGVADWPVLLSLGPMPTANNPLSLAVDCLFYVFETSTACK
jgi:hypothetical protein